MTRQLLGIVILTAGMLVGCEGENSTPAASKAAAAAQREAADAAASATKTAADAQAKADQVAANTAATAAKTAAEVKAAADVTAAATAQDAAEARIAADTKAAADENAAKATSLLTQLMESIKDNKFEIADKTLAQLDAMKGSLPASLQSKIESARAALSAKKVASSFR